ncbi:hypothetical protein ACWD1Y_41765 [Streptomyces sp. NPDC002814]
MRVPGRAEYLRQPEPGSGLMAPLGEVSARVFGAGPVLHGICGMS